MPTDSSWQEGHVRSVRAWSLTQQRSVVEQTSGREKMTLDVCGSLKSWPQNSLVLFLSTRPAHEPSHDGLTNRLEQRDTVSDSEYRP